MAKGGSKLFTGIIAFLLGFIFALLVEAGAIIGVFYYVTTQDIETIMSAVGLKNTDENGNKIYINTDPENGGVTTVKELLSGLQGLVLEDGQLAVLGKTFDDFEQLIPATNMLLDVVYTTVGEFIELDHKKFESTPINGLAQVLSDSVMGVRVGALLEKLNSDLASDKSNIVVKSLLLGAETEYATVSYAVSALAEGDAPEETARLKLPVMYDIYTQDVVAEGETSLGWFREKPLADGKNGFPDNLRGREADFIEETTVKDEQDGQLTNRTAKLCYVPCRVTETEILPAEYEIDFIEEDVGEEHYSFQYLKYAQDTDFIAVKADAAGNYVLDHAQIWASLNSSATGASDRFTGYSYYEDYGRNYYYIYTNPDTEKRELETISGKNYFRNEKGDSVQLDALTLSDLIYDAFGPLYSVSVTEVVGKNNDVAYDIFGKTTLGELLDGKVNFENLINDMEVSSVVSNVTPDNKLMAYIVFKLSDLQQVNEKTYNAVYDKFGENEQNVTVMLDEKGKINSVYAGEILLEGVKVNEIASIANNMTVNLLMDVTADDAIIAYMGYGITDVKKAPVGLDYSHTAKVKVNENGSEVSKDCFVSTRKDGDKSVITSVWYLDGDGNKVAVKGTKVSDVSDRVNKFTEELAIGDVIEITDSSNQILKSIKNTKIDQLGNKIEKLTVNELFTPQQIKESSILRQLGNATIDKLSEEIDKVVIQRIYAKQVYKLSNPANPAQEDFDPELATSYVAGNLYYERVASLDADGNELKDETGATLYTFKLTEAGCAGLTGDAYDDALGHLTQAQFEAGAYYTYGEAKGMWKLILDKGGKEKAYTINNFHNMIDSSTSNIYNATLRTLVDAKIITGIEETKLDKTVPTMTKQLGECSLKEVIEFVLNQAV